MPGTRKLGRIRPEPRRLAALPHFASVAMQLPAPPAALDFTAGGAAYAGALGNQTAGDCTLAGVGHLIQGWSAINGHPIAFGDDAALALYSELTGYDPKTGQPDDGLVETDVLDRWKTPVGLYGNRLADYAFTSPRSVLHVKQAIWVYGGIYLGLNLPEAAERQTDAGEPWTIPWFSRDLGGHCVVAQKYDEAYLYVDTWGLLQPVEWAFVRKYFDAGYAVFNPAWLDATGHTPGGLDAAGLAADLFAVADPAA